MTEQIAAVRRDLNIDDRVGWEKIADRPPYVCVR